MKAEELTPVIDQNPDLTITEVRKRCDQLIHDAFAENDPVLVSALPSIGKSYGLIKWAAETGNPLTVFTERHELFDQFTEWSAEHGLRSRKLPSSYIDCETANGTYGEKWSKRLKEKYQETQYFPGEVHKHAENLFGEPLPCQQEGNCSYFTARDFDPDEYDVLIGHYRHAYVPNRSKARYVAFDEFPSGEFISCYSAGIVTKAVREYLSSHDDLPFDYLKDLKESRRDPKRKREGLAWFERHNPNVDRKRTSNFDERYGVAHPEAATMTYAILAADDLTNRWEFAELPNGRRAVINPADDSLTLLNPPDLKGAKSVVALDGTPTVEKWELLLGDHLLHRPVLTEEERRCYLRDTLNIHVIPTSEAANHYSGRSAISVTPELDLVLFEAIGHRENGRPALITSRSALQKYEECGLSELVDETEYYGNLKGSNAFATRRVGIVAGCPHYGDDYIAEWAALAGESVSRVEGTKGMEQDFGEFGNQILRGMRENEVLQAILRFGRDGGGATVYVHTAAIPEWVEKVGTATKIHRWSDGMREILTILEEEQVNEWSTKYISEQVSISDQQVRNNFHTLTDFGYIGFRREGIRYIWFDKQLDRIGQHGHVESLM